MAVTLVLAGSGLPHLYVLESLARGRLGGARVVMVAPRQLKACAGMLSGLVAGRHKPGQLSLALSRLVRSAGAEFIEGHVRRVDIQRRQIDLDDGASVSYDVASLAVGVVPAGLSLPGVAEHAQLLKPMERATGIVEALDRAVAAAPTEGPRVVVVGAGVGGLEMALALRRRLDRQANGTGVVTIVEAAPSVLAGHGARMARSALNALRRNEVSLILGGQVAEVGAGRLNLRNGAGVPFDLLVWATGAEPPPLFAESGLVTDRRGFLQVDSLLRTIGHADVFAAGGGVAIDQRVGPEGAAVASRQGAVLSANLASVLQGRPPTRRYLPPRRNLSILDTADGSGILAWGDWVTTGAWTRWVRDRADRRLMERFKRLGN